MVFLWFFGSSLILGLTILGLHKGLFGLFFLGFRQILVFVTSESLLELNITSPIPNSTWSVFFGDAKLV